MSAQDELGQIAGYRACFHATETGFAFPWDYSAKDPTAYCVYDVVEPLVRQSDYLSLIAERDGLAKQVERMEYSDGDAEHWRHLATKAQESHTAARENFLTMQAAAAQLLKRALAAEAQLKAAREALTSILVWTKFELGPEMASKQPWSLIIAKSEAALSLDSNKGDDKP